MDKAYPERQGGSMASGQYGKRAVWQGGSMARGSMARGRNNYGVGRSARGQRGKGPIRQGARNTFAWKFHIFTWK